MNALRVAGVLLAGAAGAVARHLVHEALHDSVLVVHRGTLVVNVVGSALLGALVGLTATGRISEMALAIAGTGFCGGFTTFSGFAVNTVRVAGERRRAALRNGIKTVLLCAAAAAIGALLVGVR